MYHPQIAACSERLGLDPSCWPALVELWQAAQREVRRGPASVLTTLVEAPAPLTLDAGGTAPDPRELRTGVARLASRPLRAARGTRG